MITFIEEEHIYLNSNGVIIPSVSDLIKFKFGGYEGIPEKILKEKAEHGTSVHKAIENYINGKKQDLSLMVESSLEEYKRITKEAFIKPKEIETMIDFSERYAGRFDQLSKDDIVIDYKTTFSTAEEKWGWQLGYYALAIQKKNKKVNTKYGYVIWLPKGKRGKLIKVVYPEKVELMANLNNYENNCV